MEASHRERQGNSTVEFGAKFDLIFSTKGYIRIEKYPSIRITREQACKRLQSITKSARAIIRKGTLQIKLRLSVPLACVSAATGWDLS